MAATFNAGIPLSINNQRKVVGSGETGDQALGNGIVERTTNVLRNDSDSHRLTAGKSSSEELVCSSTASWLAELRPLFLVHRRGVVKHA